jgi:hypothetical protein
VVSEVVVSEVEESSESLRMPWDYYLGSDAVSQGYETPEQRAVYDRHIRDHVEAFRRQEWKQIAAQLKADHGWELVNGTEPLWIAPGRAIMWQQQIISVGVTKRDPDDRIYRVLEEEDHGWAPTSGLPLANAAQLAAYLEKGLRLRPPQDGVDVEVLKLLALPPQDSSEAEDSDELPPPAYTCSRHPQGDIPFTTWKGYLRHCRERNEIPEGSPPLGDLAKITEYNYYCPVHGAGFTNKKLAQRHIRTEISRPTVRQHPSLEDMQAYSEHVHTAAEQNKTGGK